MPKSFVTNRRPSFVRVLLLVAALSLLPGCSTVEGFLPHGDPNAAAIALGANPSKAARPAANASEKPIVRPVASIDVNCPPVDVAQDGAAYRVGGTDNESVRYQFNIGDTARQCDPAGPGQATIKIGVKGEVVIGPAGSPGSYSAPLRIVVTNETDKKQVFSKTYKAEATTDGVSAGSFEIVTEPIMVPMPTLQLADLYSISVGFQAAGAVPAPHRHMTHPTR
ncbi:MAG TPA: hypothetical protein VFE63_04870 [Roseiarcus sp.]|nr:hypothetical protein [Roseiarcus sp.]